MALQNHDTLDVSCFDDDTGVLYSQIVETHLIQVLKFKTFSYALIHCEFEISFHIDIFGISWLQEHITNESLNQLCMHPKGGRIPCSVGILNRCKISIGLKKENKTKHKSGISMRMRQYHVATK
jgi:hypothetical protein